MSSVHVNGVAGASVLRPRAMLPKRQSEDHCLSTSASADRLSFYLSRRTPISTIDIMRKEADTSPGETKIVLLNRLQT
ncbi:conserved hypothetical protein [Histoplasma mississippiense (nom. inval.)]|uniref:conserved hypothetical protein n=1 Tax=Ajellomyces capsulatus (strain NAm1 / WU24) TaxID=2059318 RepID=UPI000157B2BB|nr:conserved hypothetical protein [Histoplasma mississippiense (nom. inval.)]EDN02292.1 conserved hypothetical protein [Histoplasma mississippiense (nom. inval.)]